MWAILALISCFVYPALTIILYQETGPLHLHKNSNEPLPEKYNPLLPDDVKATETAETYLKQLLPKLDTRIVKSVNDIVLPELNAAFQLAVYNFMVSGLRKATLDRIALQMNNLRVDFQARIPLLTGMGTVFMNGAIDDYNFSTVGNLSTMVDDIQIAGILKFQELQLPSKQSVLQITDAEIKIDIGNAQIYFTLIEDLEDFKLTLIRFMNKPVNDIVHSVFRAAAKLINEKLAKIRADKVKQFLKYGMYILNNDKNPPPAQRRSQLFQTSYSYPNFHYGFY